MRLPTSVLVLTLIAILGMGLFPPPVMTQGTFADYCANLYAKNGNCPEGICRLRCEETGEEGECVEICEPRPCPEISAEQCPLKFCAVMVNCSEERICHYQMAGEPAACGDEAYAGQDVECCEGLIRRCGIEFLDGTCDMEGKNSVYNLPICIPCGNGICNQFENRCNCPEDCGTAPDIPLIPIH